MIVTYALAGVTLVAQPVLCLQLMIAAREGHWSPSREALFHALFFPSTLFDWLVRAITHTPPVVVFGADIADVVFGFGLNAVGWAFVVACLWFGIYASWRFILKHLTMRWSERPPAAHSRLE
jgi:hypothetical protein